MKAKGGTWTYDDLNKFIANPKGFVPGTAMGFAGIQKDSERADVIAYLHTLVGQSGSAADGGEVTAVAAGFTRSAGYAWPFCIRPGIAWPFSYGRLAALVIGTFRRSRALHRLAIMRKKQRNRSKPCLILRL